MRQGFTYKERECDEKRFASREIESGSYVQQKTCILYEYLRFAVIDGELEDDVFSALNGTHSIV